MDSNYIRSYQVVLGYYFWGVSFPYVSRVITPRPPLPSLPTSDMLDPARAIETMIATFQQQKHINLLSMKHNHPRHLNFCSPISHSHFIFLVIRGRGSIIAEPSLSIFVYFSIRVSKKFQPPLMPITFLFRIAIFLRFYSGFFLGFGLSYLLISGSLLRSNHSYIVSRLKKSFRESKGFMGLVKLFGVVFQGKGS